MPLPDDLRVRLSKKMAGLLRHYPERYGLRVDREGWARIEDLVEALHRIPGFEWVEKKHILEVVARDEKGRYEIRGDRIRARYGHSIPVEPGLEVLEEPPRFLYHGTVEESLASIRKKGILPMKRRMVHLSYTLADVVETARRHGPRVVVLIVDTQCLKGRGLTLYRAGPRVVTVRWVPPECISRVIRV